METVSPASAIEGIDASLAGAVSPPASKFRSDVLHFGVAVLISLVLNVVQVFIVPRQLSVQAYGEFRVFLLYIGYFGILHGGLIDGAFLRWVGRPVSLIRREWPVVFRRLGVIQAPAIAVIIALYVIAPSNLVAIYVVAFVACAVAANVGSFASLALQAAGDFIGAGRVTALPPAIFSVGVVVFRLSSLGGMLTTYIASYAVAAIVGMVRLAWVARTADENVPLPPALAPLSTRMLMVSGWPVLGAWLASALSLYADRLLVSFAVPAATFAFYGFASSTMAISAVARQTLSRVTLAHAAHRVGAQRAVFLDGTYDLLAAGYGASLVFEPMFEAVIARVLPRYVEALPIVRGLIPGALFWVATAVVVLGVLQTYGFVRRQLTVSVLGTALVGAGAGAAILAHAPLWAIASAGSAAAAAGWIIGVGVARAVIPDVSLRAAVRFLAIVTIQSAGLGVSLWLAGSWPVRCAVCAVVLGLPTFSAARSARRGWFT